MEIVPRLSGQSSYAGRYQLRGIKSVLVAWKMGDGLTLRLYANLAEETREGVPPIIGRRLFLQGYFEEARLGPWTVLWTVEV